MASLRDDLNALNASSTTLKTAQDAAAKASTTLSAAVADSAAKVSAFAADLKAAGGEAIDTNPNDDGTLSLYTSDGSAQGYHIDFITTLDSALPAPAPAPAPPA